VGQTGEGGEIGKWERSTWGKAILSGGRVLIEMKPSKRSQRRGLTEGRKAVFPAKSLRRGGEKKASSEGGVFA